MRKKRQELDHVALSTRGSHLVRANFLRGAGKSSPGAHFDRRFDNRNDRSNTKQGTRHR